MLTVHAVDFDHPKPMFASAAWVFLRVNGSTFVSDAGISNSNAIDSLVCSNATSLTIAAFSYTGMSLERDSLGARKMGIRSEPASCLKQGDSDRQESAIAKYGYGDCASFAAAISRISKLPIVEMYQGDELFHVALVVEGKSAKDDQFIDVFGQSSLQVIRNRYVITGRVRVEGRSERELHAMSRFDEIDVATAMSEANWLIQTGLLTLAQIPEVESSSRSSQQQHRAAMRP